MKKYICSLFLIQLLSCLGACSASAAEINATLLPNQDVGSMQWSWRSSGSTSWNLVRNSSSSDWACSTNSNNASDTYDLTTTDVQQGVVRITAYATGVAAFLFLANADNDPRIGLEVTRGGGAQVGVTNGSQWAGPLVGNPDYDSSYRCAAQGIFQPVNAFGGERTSSLPIDLGPGQELTQSEVDGMRMRVFRSGGDSRAVRLHYVRSEVTYVSHANLVQSAYRVYSNSNSINPGTPIANTNERAIINADHEEDYPFRVRINIQSQQERWLKRYGSYKLQYAQKSIQSACSSATGWTGVTANAGKVRWHTNSNVPTATQLTNANSTHDPTTGSGANVYQRYHSANAVTKSAEVPVGDSALWDFSLKVSGVSAGESFCLRVVSNEGTQPLSQYSQYPEIAIEGGVSLSVVDGSGAQVLSPQVHFGSLPTSMSCQVNSALLSTSDQKLRLRDDRLSGVWNVSMAPTLGSEARWRSGSDSYSLSNPAGSPSGCEYGQLSLNLAPTAITPVSAGCTSAGITKGTSGAFDGSTPITLAYSSNADRFCDWDITSVEMQQSVPGQTPPGDYSVNMTVTLTAS